MKKEIKENKFGKLKFVNAYYYSGWSHNGVHIVDTLQFLFNDKINIKLSEKCVMSYISDDPTLNIVGNFKALKSKISIFGFDERDYQIMEWDLFFSKFRLRISDFGNKLEIHKPLINSINEKELKEFSVSKNYQKDKPLQNAIDIIVKCLKKKSYELLKDYNILEVKKTMITIFEGREKLTRD